MRKWFISIFGLLVFLFSCSNVYAECEASTLNDLNNQARRVKPSYELKTEEVKLEDGFPDGLTEEEKENFYIPISYYMIYISNMTKDLYVTIYDNISKKETTYTYDQAVDGILSFREEVPSKLKKYTITVYSSNATLECGNRKLYTTDLVIPYYNDFSSWEPCQGIKEFYLCHEYLNVEIDKTETEFLKAVEEYKRGIIDKDGDASNDKENNGFLNFIKKNKAILVVASAVIVGGGIATVILVKKKRVNEE